MVWRLEGLQQVFFAERGVKVKKTSARNSGREKEVRSESHHFCGENAVRAPTHVRVSRFTIVTLLERVIAGLPP